jgi:hypothetical protein
LHDLWQEGFVNPARQSAAGFWDAAAEANHLTGNLRYTDPTGRDIYDVTQHFRDGLKDDLRNYALRGDNHLKPGQKNLADVAKKQVGSTLWEEKVAKDNFACNTNKCNKGVADWIVLSGRPRPTVAAGLLGLRRREPTAHEWADPNVDIPGWSKPMRLSEARPGDVIAQAHGKWGHVGIVGEPGETVSVNSTAKPDAGVVTMNEWGFRTGPLVNGVGPNGEGPGDAPAVVRRYIGGK